MARERRDLAWLRTNVSWVIDFNEGQTGQAFAGPSTEENRWLDTCINQAYDFEVNEATANCGWEWFRRYHDFTWTSDASTFVLPPELVDVVHWRWTDVTDNTPGTEVVWDAYSIAWLDEETLQWGFDGPGRDTDIRVEYLARALPLEEDSDEPELIPARFRWLLVWRAASIALAVADQAVPPAWHQQTMSLQSQFHSALEKGRPVVNNPAAIRGQPYDYDLLG